MGTWVSPGDFGDVPGVFTPDWWLRGWNQYGLRKTLTIDRAGTFLDGRKISEITIRELQLDYQSRLHFRMQAEERNGRAGGLTIFGREFGNYNQDIQVAGILRTGIRRKIKVTENPRHIARIYAISINSVHREACY